MKILVLMMLFWFCTVQPSGAAALPPWVSDKVRVIDGDSLVVGGREVRLEGMDAPEYKQSCYTAKGLAYACGVRATTYLQRLVKGKKVRCEPVEIDRYHRVVAFCYAGGKNLNAEMVRAGQAVAYDRYDDSFVPAEKEARKAGRGIWQGKFMRPEFWRLLKKK